MYECTHDAHLHKHVHTYTETHEHARTHTHCAQELQPGERFVLEEYVIDLLHWFNASHKEGTKQILSVPSSARIELLVVETVMGQLLKLPATAFKPVYYQAMLVSLCRAAPATYPAAVGRAMDALLERAPAMDVECCDRLT